MFGNCSMVFFVGSLKNDFLLEFFICILILKEDVLIDIVRKGLY